MPQLDANDGIRGSYNATPASAKGPRIPMAQDPQEAVLRLLPDTAGLKLRDLRERAEEKRAVLTPLLDQGHELRKDMLRCQTRISALKQNVRVPIDDDHPSLLSAQEQLAEIRDRLNRNQQRVDDVSEKWRQHSELVARIETYVSDLRGSGFVEQRLADEVDAARIVQIHTAPSKPSASEASHAAIDRVRKQIAEARADLHTVTSAPIKSDAAKAIARADIERLAEIGCPDCTGLIEIGADIEWPKSNHAISTLGASVGVGRVQLPDSLAFLVWLNRDAVIAAVEREIDILAIDDQALTDTERAKRTVKLSADILAFERQEELQISAAEARGAELVRRVDADPRAVLGLASTLPAPVV